MRQNPGRLSYASVGGGSASHLTMELLKSEAGIALVHVPYRGFPQATTDMLAGNIDAMFAIVPAVLPQVRAGKMKGLAVTGLKRSPIAPDVPSVAELGLPGLESLAWNGLLAPARHLRRGRCPAEHRDRQGNAESGDAGGARAARIRRRGELAGGVFALDSRRIGEMVARDPRERRHGGLNLAFFAVQRVDTIS